MAHLIASEQGIRPDSRPGIMWLVAWVLMFTASAQGQERLSVPNRLALSTNFPGGSAEIRSLNPDTAEIHIQPANTPGRGWPCWWYFRLDGLAVGQTVRVKVSGNPTAFRESTVLDASWCQPDRAAISIDDVAWSQTPLCQRTADRTAVYTFDAPAERVWLAWGPPFLPAHADDLLTRIEKQLPAARRFTLARTIGDRAVQGIQLDQESASQFPRRAIWVQARQHAWESGSSWVGRGFLEWAAGADPSAIELRRRCTIFFVPIMDVDNVAQGAGGKEAVPRDHNRDWADEPVYPEVAAAQGRLRRLDDEGSLTLFVDLHNPGPRDQKPYYYGPFQEEQLTAGQKENHARWLAYSIDAIRDPLPLEPAYRAASYVKTDEERNRMSRNWVVRHTSPSVLAVTLETAWNTPHSVPSGYLAVGRQLGEVISRYVESLDSRQ